jgi:hypothetical protein
LKVSARAPERLTEPRTVPRNGTVDAADPTTLWLPSPCDDPELDAVGPDEPMDGGGDPSTVPEVTKVPTSPGKAGSRHVYVELGAKYVS